MMLGRLAGRWGRCLWVSLLLVSSAPAFCVDVGQHDRADAPAADSDRRSGAAFRLSISSDVYRLAGAGGGRDPRAASLSGLIDRQAARAGLSSDLVHAVIQVESGYRVEAVSPKGALGLMQVMPATGARFGETALSAPDANVRAGTHYLRYLIDRFDDLPLALAAYNAGEGAVIRHGHRVPPYRETQRYVQDVLRRIGAPAAGRASRSVPHYGEGFVRQGGDAAYRLRLEGNSR